jgi:hypothetical protein
MHLKMQCFEAFECLLVCIRECVDGAELLQCEGEERVRGGLDHGGASLDAACVIDAGPPQSGSVNHTAQQRTVRVLRRLALDAAALPGTVPCADERSDVATSLGAEKARAKHDHLVEDRIA